MRKSNLTYEQLIELAPKDRPFQVEVENGDIYWCWTKEDKLLICFMDNNVFYLEDIYKGTFTLIDEYRNIYEKPEVLEVGTEVEILESARECGDYDGWNHEQKNMIGKIGKVISFYDKNDGIVYWVKNGNYAYYFPHYCVRPVEKVEEKEEIKGIPEFEDTISQLNNLFTQAQDIISKYKK